MKVVDVDECGCRENGRPRAGDGAADDDEARAFQAPMAALASASLLAGTTWCTTNNRHRDTFDRLDSSWALPHKCTWR